MSETDSFIDEVTEEVRRDKLFATIRKYGWIAIVGVVAIVGGAAYNEYAKAQHKAQAEEFGSAIMAALGENDAAARIDAFGKITAPSPAGAALLAMLKASEQSSNGAPDQAAQTLAAIANDPTVDTSYRDIANFKRLIRTDAGLDQTERLAGFNYLATPGNPLRLLASEQLALIDLENGDQEAAIKRLSDILQDAEITQGLRSRVTQLMIALGQDPSAAN